MFWFFFPMDLVHLFQIKNKKVKLLGNRWKLQRDPNVKHFKLTYKLISRVIPLFPPFIPTTFIGAILIVNNKVHMLKDVILWAWTSKPKKIFLGMSTKYYLTHRMKYLVTWRIILPHVMDELFWMIKLDEISNEHWQQIKLHFPPLLLIILIYT